MTHYMVIERFRAGNSDAVYERFAARGRMLPDGLEYVESWLSARDDTCFQVMRAENRESFDNWTRHWDDLADFEIIELKEKPTGSPKT